MNELSVKFEASSKSNLLAQKPAQVSFEAELMGRVAQGDDHALKALFDQHGNMLARLVGRLTGWHADADDILQEVTLKIWTRAGSYKGNGSLEGWLKRIAVHQCHNHYRATQRFRRLLEKVANRSGEIGSSSVYSEVSEKTELQHAISLLPSNHRTVIVLYYLEEMSGEEVASMLGVSPSTLHKRLNRARTRLKTILNELQQKEDSE